MACLLSVRFVDAGAAGADFLQRVGQPARVARELDGGGVGEELALAADRAFDQLAEEGAGRADDNKSDANEGKGIIAPASLEQNLADHHEADDAEDDTHEPEV